MISDCAGPNGTPNRVLMSGVVPTTGAGPALATPSLALICDAAAAASCAALLALLFTHTHTHIQTQPRAYHRYNCIEWLTLSLAKNQSLKLQFQTRAYSERLKTSYS